MVTLYTETSKRLFRGLNRNLYINGDNIIHAVINNLKYLDDIRKDLDMYIDEDHIYSIHLIYNHKALPLYIELVKQD
jgi:hypothetical protein